MEGRMTMTLPMPNEDPGPAARARPKRRIPRRTRRRASTAQRARLAIDRALSLAHTWLSDHSAHIKPESSLLSHGAHPPLCRELAPLPWCAPSSLPRARFSPLVCTLLSAESSLLSPGVHPPLCRELAPRVRTVGALPCVPMDSETTALRSYRRSRH
jgi:hypothetical protein